MNDDGSTPCVAVLGVGLMGAPMARRLLAAGLSVHAWNRSPAKAEALVADGACEFSSIAEATRGADFVVTMLAGYDALDDVMFGPGGVAASAPRDAIIVDMSSLAPDLARHQHEKLADSDFAHLDAPVSGGVPGAEAGTLSIMVGGSVEVFARATLLFAPMGTAFHLGDAGAGQVCKLVNQIIVHISIGAVTEELLLAETMGVNAGKVREAISGGFCKSQVLELHGARLVERNFAPGGPLQFSVKDLEGAAKHAEGATLDLPLTAGESLLKNCL